MSKRMLVLENGKFYIGEGFGSSDTRIAEIVFDTAMVGYQEILSDAVNYSRIVVMSYPLIGNYGMTDDDYESKGIYTAGMVVREYNDVPSNFRFTKTLSEVMRDAGVAGLSGVDTREIVKIIRDEGAMRAMITDAVRDVGECVKELKAYALPSGQVAAVSTKNIWFSRTRNPQFNIAVADCGGKLSLIKKLNANGCNVIVVPYNTPYEEIMKYKPDGLVISEGPGDPAEAGEVIELVKKARGKLPIMGAGLGMQIIAIAYGGKTVKMLNGHRGANYPVREAGSEKVEITSQNHGYAVDADSLKNTSLKVTHVNVIDGDAEGAEDAKAKVVCAEYGPSEVVGSDDNGYLFDRFIGYLRAGGKKNAKENRY